ncbi:DUF2306 domain-containing protein [Sphingomonas jaspsi]|uniref:DUF2306 domain-containing protein n=1 Tax=Sphingomonas jaspsi TaxID=392409 RepID=UPI001FE06E92|nr:DUF2306 domain-containing protein [Sphingomonas jaspsi]
MKKPSDSLSMPSQSPSDENARSLRWIKRAAQGCFAAIATGQGLFLTFILAFYYPTTLRGEWAHWNAKPLIDGFKVGDTIGNLFFAMHVLLAAVITAGGVIQLVPAIRIRAPSVHRWIGRIYMVTAMILAVGGLWLVWGRGTYLSTIGAVGISADAVAMLTFAGLAWRSARARNYAQHRRWALRLFAVASAVWFMRVGYMVWGIATGGVGIGPSMDGPFDFFIAFGNSLLPLAIAEAYLRALERPNKVARYGVTALLATSATIVVVGSAGAWFVMWKPFI